MAIKAYNPTTPGRRGMTSQDTAEITTRKPLRSLIVKKRTQSGRNNQGRITTRHKGWWRPSLLPHYEFWS